MGTLISAEPASTTVPIRTDVLLTDEGMTTTPATKRKQWLYFLTGAGAITGWVPAEQTWAYASTSTITVPTGAAAIYSVGDKLQWYDTVGTIYAYVVSVADTVLTIAPALATNHTYTLPFYSKASSPVGFAQWFAYTPTGGPTTNVTQTGRFMIQGRTVFAFGRMAFTGAPAAWTGNPSIPVTASANLIGLTPLGIMGWGAYRDSGTATLLYGAIPEVLASGTTVLLFKADGTAFSTTVPITWANGDFCEYVIQYEI